MTSGGSALRVRPMVIVCPPYDLWTRLKNLGRALLSPPARAHVRARARTHTRPCSQLSLLPKIELGWIKACTWDWTIDSFLCGIGGLLSGLTKRRCMQEAVSVSSSCQRKQPLAGGVHTHPPVQPSYRNGRKRRADDPQRALSTSLFCKQTQNLPPLENLPE